jgi:hypothetical protein
MSSWSSALFGAFALTSTITLLPAAIPAQTLPAAREIVARHVTAIGGRDAILAKQSVRTTGTFELPAMGIEGNFDAAQMRDGATVMRIELPGLGQIASGYDGRFAWATNPMIGPRLLEGAELAQIRDDASFLASLREAPAVKELETVGIADVGGEQCYRIRIAWASGRRTFDCYSIESGLLIGSEMTQLSPTGALDITVSYADYRDFGGVRMATVARQRAAGQEQVLRFTNVEFDAVPAELFAAPPEVEPLIQRAREASPAR